MNAWVATDQPDLIAGTALSTSRDRVWAWANTSETAWSGAGRPEAMRSVSRCPWIIDMMLGSLMVQTHSTPSETIGRAISVNRANASTASGARHPPRSANQRGTVKCSRVTIGVSPNSWQAATIRR
jgi:hypothetical protein